MSCISYCFHFLPSFGLFCHSLSLLALFLMVLYQLLVLWKNTSTVCLLEEMGVVSKKENSLHYGEFELLGGLTNSFYSLS